MRSTRLKIGIVGVALALGVGLLTLAGVREGWLYYLSVDEFLEGSQYHDDRVRLHGTVGEDDLESSPTLLTASFELLGEGGAIRVVYEGVVPDQFQAGRDVVVEGALDAAGVFQADTLMTKCASKYESDDGEAPHADPRLTGSGS